MKIYTKDHWRTIGSPYSPLSGFKESRSDHIGMIKAGIISRQPISFGGIKVRQYIIYHYLLENMINRVKSRYASIS